MNKSTPRRGTRRVLVAIAGVAVLVLLLVLALKGGDEQERAADSTGTRPAPSGRVVASDAPALSPQARAQQVKAQAADQLADVETVPELQVTRPAINSPKASSLPGASRPCKDARDFSVYWLGPKFGTRWANDRSASCQPSPRSVDGKLAVPTRTISYGTCRESTASGCGYALSVQNIPSCERPLSLYTALSGPPGLKVGPLNIVRVRGVPALIADGGQQIDIFTRDTTIVIFGPDERSTLRAARAVVRVNADDAASDPLPAPSKAVSSKRLGTVKCAPS